MGETVMRKKVRFLFAVVILVIGLVAATMFAGTTTSYSTTTRQLIGAVTNSASVTKTVYCRLIPGGGVAVLQICDATGTVILSSDIYPLYPQNPYYTTCSIPAYTTRRFYVKPAIAGEYIWGYAEYGIFS